MSSAKNGCNVYYCGLCCLVYLIMYVYVFTDGPNTHCAPGVCSQNSAQRSTRSKTKGKLSHMEPHLKL